MPIPSVAEIKLILIAVAMLGIASVTAIGVHKIEDARYQKLTADIAQKNAAAQAAAMIQQNTLNQISAAADKQAIADKQAQLDAANARLAAIPKHVVKGAGNCLTWGLLRTIDAAVFGVDADTLPMPAGKTDASCADADSASQLAAEVLGNTGVGQRNAAQLKALQNYVDQISKVKR